MLPAAEGQQPATESLSEPYQESTMKRLALTILALTALAGTAFAQDRARHQYSQRTDPYALVFNYWAEQQFPEGFNAGFVYRGTGFVVGTNLRCNVCGAAGHYSCGANVPLFFTHYAWLMMP
jgi:hypothetical protein